MAQSLATASPKISRRRGRDSLANLQFGEAKEIVHEDDEFSLNQPKKANFNGNSSHEAGSDGLEKPSGERKLTQRKKYVHRVSTVQTMAGINIPRGNRRF